MMAVLLLVGMLPMQAFAEEPASQQEQTVQTPTEHENPPAEQGTGGNSEDQKTPTVEEPSGSGENSQVGGDIFHR